MLTYPKAVISAAFLFLSLSFSRRAFILGSKEGFFVALSAWASRPPGVEFRSPWAFRPAGVECRALWPRLPWAAR